MHSRELPKSVSVRHFLSNLTVRILLLCSQAIRGESALPLIVLNFDITKQSCFTPPRPACFTVTEVKITEPINQGALLNRGRLWSVTWSLFRHRESNLQGFRSKQASRHWVSVPFKWLFLRPEPAAGNWSWLSLWAGICFWAIYLILLSPLPCG